MLSDLQVNPRPALNHVNQFAELRSDDRYSRNMKEDMKEAIDLLFKLKDGLDKLHPECIHMIEKMMACQNRTY